MKRRSSRLRRRSPLRPRGERAEREAPYLDAARAVVLERAGGRCERCGRRGALEVHHRRARSHGLPPERKHDPDEMAGLCKWCHAAVHDHGVPDWETWVINRSQGTK